MEPPEYNSEDSPSLIYASISGPELAEKATAAGVGGKVDGAIGAMVEYHFILPVRLTGTVGLLMNEQY